jgi:hypothetical protein
MLCSGLLDTALGLDEEEGEEEDGQQEAEGEQRQPARAWHLEGARSGGGLGGTSAGAGAGAGHVTFASPLTEAIMSPPGAAGLGAARGRGRAQDRLGPRGLAAAGGQLGHRQPGGRRSPGQAQPPRLPQVNLLRKAAGLGLGLGLGLDPGASLVGAQLPRQPYPWRSAQELGIAGAGRRRRGCCCCLCSGCSVAEMLKKASGHRRGGEASWKFWQGAGVRSCC